MKERPRGITTSLGEKFECFVMIFFFIQSRFRWLYDILFPNFYVNSVELRRQVESLLKTVQTELNFRQIFIDIQSIFTLKYQ